MVFEHRFIFPLANGLHARPASYLEAVASRFPAAVALFNVRNWAEADAKSVLSLVSADIRHGDECVLRVSGPDAGPALEKLTAFLEDEFPHCDEALPEIGIPVAHARLSRALKAAGVVEFFGGIPACRGLAQATIVHVGGLSLAADFIWPPATSPGEELASFEKAVGILGHALEKEIASSREVHQGDVLRAHAAILRDVALAGRVAALLAEHRYTAGQAAMTAVEEFSATLRQASSVYLRERVLDLQDVAGRLLTQLYGSDAVTLVPVLTAPAIVVAESLTPGQFLALDRHFLRGLVLAHAGATSHTVILARSFGIPTLIGVSKGSDLPFGKEIILDAYRGILIPEISVEVCRYYALEAGKLARLREANFAYRDRPGASKDGKLLPILANLSSVEEVSAAVASGAEGVGLFRTEMLYMDRGEAPSEDEQFAVYSATARAAQGRPVIIRTIDVGGDKPVGYLNLPSETNPFLGYRGVRLYDEFSSLVKTQLRAILRASVHGSLKIMVPMISCLEEMRGFRALIEEVRAELRGDGLPDGAGVAVGMVIEVPSAVFALPELARAADFFSIGTNDLAQYFLAADRDNSRVSSLNSWMHPAFLRLLKQAVDGAHAHDCPIGLCGEMSEHADAQPILLGLGFDSLSMGAPRILATKAALAQREAERCRELAAGALACVDRIGVEALIQNFRAEGSAVPLISGDVIVLDSDAETKVEVIKELTDLLDLGGRTSDANAVEEAVWTREETYSTGFGYGFAVPHCKSPRVIANTIALLRLRSPVEWGSLDGAPVKVAILLAIRDSDHDKEHMRILSRLSRLVMRDEFRERLETATDVSGVLATLNEQLSLAPVSIAS